MTTQPTQPAAPTAPATPAMATGELQFHDAANWQQIPPGLPAALYADGEFAVLPSDATLFSQVRWITVTGDYATSGIIDWEPGNPCFSPGGLRRFVRGRRSMGKRARVYVDRADAAEAIAALRDFGHGQLLGYSGLEWWIATLDGYQWTPEQLASDLITRWDAPIPAVQIWANQWLTNGAYDTSSLFLPW